MTVYLQIFSSFRQILKMIWPENAIKIIMRGVWAATLNKTDGREMACSLTCSEIGRNIHPDPHLFVGLFKYTILQTPP